MNQTVSDYLTRLTKIGIEHSVIEHPSIKNPAEVMKHLGLPLSDALPTLIMKADNNFVAVVRRGGTQLHTKQLKKELGVKNLRLANEEEFTRLTNVPVGAAQVYNPGLKTILDKKIFDSEYLYGGSGTFTETIKYKTEDLKKIPGSIVVSIAESGTKRVLSGIRATGRLHLGNYLGAVKGMLALQNDPEYETLYMVADVHTLTTPYLVEELRKNRREIIIDYLAAGLDPEKSVLFQQSLVNEHIELAFYFSSVTTIAKMQHLPTFKDKVKQHPQHATMALLNYPLLMASDILVYKAGLVPVGIDQEPHLEISREIARSMNQTYGTDFPEPQRFATAGEYVPSLTGEGKMSKSVEGSYINITDSLEEIKRKIAKVPTDSGTTGGDIPTEGGVSNLFILLSLFSDKETFLTFEKKYNDGSIRYAELKQVLSEAIHKDLLPIQEKRKELEVNPEYVDKVIREGAEKARSIAQETVREVKEKMGLL